MSSYAKSLNTDLAAYTQAMAEIAKAHRAVFVDLFTASSGAYKASVEGLTTQGIHLNDAGNRVMQK